MAMLSAVIRKMAWRLVEPPSQVRDPSERDRMALLSAMLLGMAVLNIAPAPRTPGSQAPLTAFLSLLLVCYGISRTRRYKIAVAITIALCTCLQAFLISKTYDP